LVAEVQEAANRHQKIERGFHAIAGGHREQSVAIGPGAQFIDYRQQGEPGGHVVIAQASGAVFDVGLEMKYGAVEFGVADAGEVHQVLDDVLRFAGH
jgi:hypothetical protein